MLELMAFDYAIPAVTQWQGYTTFTILAGIGLVILLLAFKAARIVLIIVALLLIASAWPARNFVQSRVQAEVERRIKTLQKEEQP